jgi:hypothetical protein
MFKEIYYNRRSYFYGGVITLGLVFLMNIKSFNETVFPLSALILYLIIVFEMFYTWFMSKEKLRQMDLPLVSDYSRFKQILHHLLMPSILYLGIVGFIYFNNQIALHIPLLVIAYILFTALFINLRAFYQDKFQLEKETYFVYDLIELTTFFTTANTLINLVYSNSWHKFIIIVGIFILALLILILNLYQFESLTLKPILAVLGMSLLIAVIMTVLLYTSAMTIVALSFMSFLTYYFLFGVLSHKIEGTLSWEVVLEYVAVFVLCLAFLLGVS